MIYVYRIPKVMKNIYGLKSDSTTSSIDKVKNQTYLKN